MLATWLLMTLWITCGKSQSVYPTCVRTVSDCKERPSGQYPSCHDCRWYIVCAEGHYYPMRCYKDLVYDTSVGRCRKDDGRTCTKSPTKKPTTSNTHKHGKKYLPGFPTGCLTNCVGMEDGRYHSCWGCNFVANCYLGSYRETECTDQTWDDVLKKCRPKSATCGNEKFQDEERGPEPVYGPTDRKTPLLRQPPVPSSIIKKPALTSSGKRYPPGFRTGCITDCDGLPEGSYHSCTRCNIIAQCYHGSYSETACSEGNWDDVLKQCQDISQTCGKVSAEDTGPEFEDDGADLSFSPLFDSHVEPKPTSRSGKFGRDSGTFGTGSENLGFESDPFDTHPPRLISNAEIFDTPSERLGAESELFGSHSKMFGNFFGSNDRDAEFASNVGQFADTRSGPNEDNGQVYGNFPPKNEAPRFEAF